MPKKRKKGSFLGKLTRFGKERAQPTGAESASKKDINKKKDFEDFLKNKEIR